jgi:Tol biopolymer transport system component
VVASTDSAQAARPAANGGWIAYSTAPADDQTRGPGSDVFLVHPGGEPRLVAGRGQGKTWNLCPTISPDGSMLAYGRRAPGASSIRVVGVSRDGTLVPPRATIKLPFNFRTACPKWSTDGSRMAYLGRSGKVVVHGLDGSIQQPRPGDPVVRDFSRDASALVSPAGDLITRRPGNGCDVVVSRRDGSRRRVVDDFPCGYAIAGWSPDARKLLVMKDMDGQHSR